MLKCTCILIWRERQTEVYRFYTPPQALPSPSCSPRWPSAVSSHHLCAVALPANHTHCDVSNLRHTTSESTPQVQIKDQFTIPQLKSESVGVENENLTFNRYLQSNQRKTWSNQTNACKFECSFTQKIKAPQTAVTRLSKIKRTAELLWYEG